MQHYLLSFANTPAEMNNEWMQRAIVHLDNKLVDKASFFSLKMYQEVRGLQRLFALDMIRHGGKDLYGHAETRF